MLSLVKIFYQHLLIELPFLMVRKANWPWHLLTIVKTVESLYKEVLRWGVPVPLSMLEWNQCKTCAEILIHFRPPTSVDGGWCLQGYAYTQGIFSFREYLVCNIFFVFLSLPPFIQSPVIPISYSMHTGRWCAMKRYIRMLPLSVLNGSWYQLHLRWNARWIQKIMCLGLAEGKFLADCNWKISPVCAYICASMQSLLRTRMFE